MCVCACVHMHARACEREWRLERELCNANEVYIFRIIHVELIDPLVCILEAVSALEPYFLYNKSDDEISIERERRR